MSVFVIAFVYAGVASGMNPDLLEPLSVVLGAGILGVCRLVFPRPRPVRRARRGRWSNLATELPIVAGTLLVLITAVATILGRRFEWLTLTVGLVLIAAGAAIDHWRRRPLLPQ